MNYYEIPLNLDLSKKNLAYKDLSHANLSYADISNSYCLNGFFWKSDLSYANLKRSLFSLSDFCEVNLSFANCYLSDLSNIKVDEKTNFDGTNFNKANLDKLIVLSDKPNFTLLKLLKNANLEEAEVKIPNSVKTCLKFMNFNEDRRPKNR